MTEIVVGVGVILESAFHSLRINFLKSVFVIVALLLICHFFVTRGKGGKILTWSKALIVVLIIVLCMSGFIYFYRSTHNAYATLFPSMEPLDLKCNFYGALESKLYKTTLGDKSEWVSNMPAIFTPPFLAWLRFLTIFFSDDFAQYAWYYRICGIASAVLILVMLVCIASKKLGKRSMSGIALISFSISVFLFLSFYFVTDIRIGNTNTFVGLLVSAQLLMTFWESDLSKFLQAFVLVLAWWIKPNMILVIWCLTIFSISRKEYPYLIGLICGVVLPVGASLLAANVSLETYVIYLTQVSKVIENQSLGHGSNLSIFSFADNPILAYRIALLLGAILVLVYTIKVKRGNFFKFEIFSFIIAYIFWTRVWAYYFIPVALITWFNTIDRISERKPIYLELILILGLSMALMLIDVIWVNLMLVANATVYIVGHACWSRQELTVS